MQDGFGSTDRGVARPEATALVAVLALLSVAVPTAGQPINGSANASEQATETRAASPSTESRVISCQQLKDNLNGDPAEPYRIVRGSCSLSIEDGEILSRVWFKADGGAVDIDASGSGWTIRNIAVTNHGAPTPSRPLTWRLSGESSGAP